MTYTAIDGDISDFIDSMIDQADEFSTDQLRLFLMNAGHPIADTVNAVVTWQKDRFEALDPSWDRFKLTPVGRVAVEELRAR